MKIPNALRKEGHQCGASLIAALVMLVAVLMLGISATYIALQGERASRNERDRQIAFQAAEAALMDAELDIEKSPSVKSRSAIFSKNSVMGFPAEGEETCRAGLDNNFLGLCKHSFAGVTQTWLTVDFSDVGRDTTCSVPIGLFTGQSFQTERGALPVRVPRYIIELMIYNSPGQSTDQPTYFYRITAIGYGAHDTTQVVLQTFYRKEN
jgi:type IV pilus assembly protein PilX